VTNVATRDDVFMSLTYESEAVEPMSVEALRDLERAAQARNRAERVTGLAIYDDGRFFQWLEGPTEPLARVWDSINRDPRHTNLANVTLRSTSARVFAEWDMRLTIRGDAPLRTLGPRARPLSLGAPRAHVAAAAELHPAQAVDGEPTGFVVPVVPVVVDAITIPHVFSKYGTVRRFLPPVSPMAARLSQLLLADDARPAERILRGLYDRAGSLAPLCATVLEPAARTIGDRWLADDCSEVAMTTALGRLHAMIRLLVADATPATLGLPVVLVAAQPGELHLLGATLDAELLWQAGWDTHQEFPATNAALQATLAETWFDVLDLSLSQSLPRSDRLPSMAETIAGARAASRNPALTVLVGGRAFFEQCQGSESVGADASTTSALHVVLTATSARQTTLTKLATQQVLATTG
jgi:hypothetical protein